MHQPSETKDRGQTLNTIVPNMLAVKRQLVLVIVLFVFTVIITKLFDNEDLETNRGKNNNLSNDLTSVDEARTLSIGFSNSATDVEFGNVAASNSYALRHLLSTTNNTSKSNSTKLASLSTAERIAFTFGHIVCLLLTLIGNFLLIVTVTKCKEFHSNTNFLLCNLAFADILRALTQTCYELYIIIKLGNGTYHIPALPGARGHVLCKMIWTLPIFFQAAVLFGLIVLTFERFVAIVFPFRTAQLQDKTKFFILGVWILAFLLSAPILYATKSFFIDETHYICETDFSPFSSTSPQAQYDAYITYVKVLFYLSYLVPFAIILVLNAIVIYVILKRRTTSLTMQPQRSSTSNTRIAAMVGTISVIFALTLFPNQIYIFMYINNSISLHTNQPVYFTFLLLFIAEISSTVNPWVYPLFVRRFRTKYLGYIPKCCRPHDNSRDRSSSDSRLKRRLFNSNSSTKTAQETVM